MSADQESRTWNKTVIYVALLDEGVDVWRPVTAEAQGHGVYRIISEQPDDEKWQFLPGALVFCEERRFCDGSLGLVAKRLWAKI